MQPAGWVRWATKLDDAKDEDCEVLSGELNAVSRQTDTLILVKQSSVGKFLALFEIQTRYSPQMPLRMRVYAALAEQTHNLPVFPVLINILPYSREIPTAYESNFLGIAARQDYYVINLWQLDAEAVLAGDFTALIPFLPVMQGGTDENLLRKAQAQLQISPTLRRANRVDEMQFALSIFTEAVLGKGAANQILRWNMFDIFVESPLYQEIVQQGLQQGLQQGVQQGVQQGRREELQKMLTRQLNKRLGAIGEATKQQLAGLPIETAEELIEAIFDFADQADLQTWLNQRAANEPPAAN